VPIAALSLLVGIVSASVLPVMPGVATALILPCLVPGLLIRRARVLSIALLGMALLVVAANQALDDRLIDAGIDAERVVTGRVADMPVRDPGRLRFSFALDASHRAAGLPRLVRLNWYRPPVVPEAGERWRLRIRLRSPHGTQNPGGFDYEQWLLSRRVGATGYVKNGPVNERLQQATFSWLALRARLERSVRHALGDSDTVPVITALLIGVRTGIAPHLDDLLRASGTSHLMAISGLHIAMAAAAGALAGRLLWRLIPARRAPARQPVTVGAALLSAGAYALIAGLGLPTRRALLMIGVAAFMAARRRQVAPWRVFALALIAVLVVDPLAPLGAGFWLSFVAVAALLLQTLTDPAPRPLPHRWARAQIGVSLALVVPLLMLYGQVPIVSPLANLFAIPVFSTAVVPLTLLSGSAALAGLPVADLLFGLLDKLVAAALGMLAAMVRLVPAVLEPGRPPYSVLLLAGAGSLLALLPRGLGVRALAPLLITPALFWRPSGPDEGGFLLTVLDVGQGLSAVVETRRHALVFDAGPAWPGGDAGARTVVPYLRHRGLARLDALVVSHSDLDHRGGVQSLLGARTVERIYAGPATRISGRLGLTCMAGMVWRWDGVEFRFLHPDPASAAVGNDTSCVLAVAGVSGRVLLTGDIEAGAEARLVGTGHDLNVDLVVAPHHGSSTSSTAAFVAATRSRWVIYPAGWRNRWGFPRPEVVARWSASHADGWITGRDGAVLAAFPGQGEPAPPVGWRCLRRRFWQHRDCGG